MLIVDALNIRFQQRQILRDISLDIQQGSFCVFLGSNGAGKSTLLKSIAGNLKYQGSICYKNKQLRQWSTKKLATERSVLSQNIVLIFPMKVIDVVLLGRYAHKSAEDGGQKDRAMALELLQLLGIEQYAEENILHLSGGEQQRVHIARVLSQVWDSSPAAPKLLLLDEPTSNLDIKYQHLLLDLLKKRVKTNALTVIAVLHDLNLAARYASDLVYLKKGELLEFGPISKTLNSEIIQATFGVSSVIQKNPLLNCLQISTFQLK